jgi:hypothetical protein
MASTALSLVALLLRGPQPRVIGDLPVLAVEILSREDRYSA